jgi:hypothetical protein
MLYWKDNTGTAENFKEMLLTKLLRRRAMLSRSYSMYMILHNLPGQ